MYMYIHMYVLAHDSDGFILSAPLQLGEVGDEFDEELRAHSALLWPGGHLVLCDGEGGGVLERRWRGEGEGRGRRCACHVICVCVPHNT